MNIRLLIVIPAIFALLVIPRVSHVLRVGAQVPTPPLPPPTFPSSPPPATLLVLTATPTPSPTSTPSPSPTATSTPTATVKPTATVRPTPTLPAARVLLRRSLRISRARGSVHEAGTVRVDQLVDEQRFASDLSWRHHLARISQYFPYGSQFGNHVEIRATAKHLAEYYRGRWHCSHPNAAVWAPPSVGPLRHILLTPHIVQISGHKAWRIFGQRTIRTKSETARLVVGVFIDRASLLLFRIVEKGEVTRSGMKKSALLLAVVDYTHWGEHVRVTLPAACRATHPR
jgi:hypothetical protein